MRFNDTIVGGLSGIDYNPHTLEWIIESDDRSEVSPARFYTARLDYDAHTFSSVKLTDMHFFHQADGTSYPSPNKYPKLGGEVPDIESIRYDPFDGTIWYASEGYQRYGMGPFVKHATPNGRYLGNLPVGPQFSVIKGRPWGPRDNLSFESLSFATNGQSLWLGMETALYQDGPVSNLHAGAVARFTHYKRDGRILGQYAYLVDPIPHTPQGKLADNGVSEILTVDATHLLTIERSGTQNTSGKFDYWIRIYEADIGGATNIAHIASLIGAKYAPAKKRLVVDINRLGLAHVDNIEGMTWGPRLANGHDSLVLVSDNNFDSSQTSQFLAFEVIPHLPRSGACP